MVSSYSSSEFHLKHLGLIIGFGAGFLIGVSIKRFYGRNDNKKDELVIAIGNLADQVHQLSQIVSNLKRESSESDKGKEYYENDHGGDDEDGDVFFEFAQNKAAVELPLRDIDADVAERLKVSEQLREGTDQNKEECYELLMELSKMNGSNAEILWRLGRAHYDMALLAGKDGKLDKKRHLIEQAIETCKQAVETDSNNASAHKWYGIAIGNYVEFVGSQEKIALGFKYKEHIEKAIELNPEDPAAYSLLGRWCYEVYMLPWFLRKIAAAVYGEPPNSSIDEALGYAMKAEELKPNFWKENSLLIAKCHYQKSDYKDTKRWLEKAKDLPIESEDDVVAQQEITDLLLKV